MTRPLAILTLFVALFIAHPASAQVQPDEFRETLHIGRGAVLDAQWDAGGSTILVNTVTGLWIYSETLTDKAHLPDVRLARYGGPNRSSYMAGIDPANNVMVWDWDGRTITQYGTYPGNTAYVTALEWSPYGNQIATLDHTGRILVFTLQGTFFEVRLNGASQIAWSKGGSYLAAMNPATQVFVVWDKTGKMLLEDKPEYAAESGAIEWRNDTQLLQIQYSRGGTTGQLWNVPAKKQVWDNERDFDYFSAYSPDGSKIAASSTDRAFISDADTDDTLSIIDRPQWAEIAWSADGKYVAFGDRTVPQTENATTFIVDAITGSVTKELHSYNTGIQHIYWSPDGTRLLTVYTNQEMAISSTNPQVSPYSSYGSIAHTDIGATLAWNADGTRIVAADTYNGARLWDAETGDLLTFRMNMTSQPATKIAWQPGGTLVATTSDDGWTSKDHNVYIWETANPTQELKPFAVIPQVNNVTEFAWSPDGTTLATMESTSYIHLWKPTAPSSVETIAVGDYDRVSDSTSISNLLWSSKSDILMFLHYYSDGYGSKALIRITDQKLLPDDDENRDDFVNLYTSFAWTPDNRLISASWNDIIGIGFDFDPDHPTSTEHSYETFQPPKRATNAILSPHGSKVIGFDVANDAIIWDLQPQSLRVRLYGVNDAVWSPDESMLVTYGVDGVLRVVDATTGAILHSFDDHVNVVYSRIGVFWSPDSRKIALLDRGALFIYEKSA